MTSSSFNVHASHPYDMTGQTKAFISRNLVTVLSDLFSHNFVNLTRVIFVGGSRGTSPSLDLTFPPTGLSKNLGEWKGGGEGKGKGNGGGDHLPYLPPLTSASNTTLPASRIR